MRCAPSLRLSNQLASGRVRRRKYTDQLTALDGFVDALRSDPPSRHWFELAVKRLVADPRGDTSDRTALATWFAQLSDAVPTVRQQMVTSPRLAELSTRAGQLLQLAAMGQHALQYLANGERAPADWKAEQIETLDEVSKPSALVRFNFLTAMTELVKAVAE
jgi:hexosaminidase